MSDESLGLAERLSRQLATLQQLSQVINTHPNPEKALSGSLELISQALGLEKCFVLLHEPKTAALVPLFPVYGFPAETHEQLRQLRIDLNGPPSVTVKAFSLAQPVKAYSQTSSKIVLEAGLHSELAVPILLEGQVQGVLVGLNKATGPFDKVDEQSFSAMAAILASLLRNQTLSNNLKAEQRRYQAMLEIGVDGLVEIDRDFKVINLSRGAEILTGWKKAEAIGHSCQEVLLPHSPENDLLCARCPMKRAFSQGSPVTEVETLIYTHESEDIWVSCSYNGITDQQGEIIGGVIAIKDIQQVRARDDELKQQIQHLESLQGVIDAISGLSNIEEIYRCALLEVANSINFDIGMIHSIDHTNDTLVLRTLYERSEELESIEQLLNLKDSSSNSATAADNEDDNLEQTEFYKRSFEYDEYPPIPVSSCNNLQNEVPNIALGLPGQDICPVLSGVQGLQSHLCVPIRTQDYSYGVMHLGSYRPYAFGGSDFNLAVGISKQIAVAAERARLFEEVGQLARTDPMTGLYNKREFWERIENEMRRAERQRRPLTLMMIDLDRLKWFNDFYGHAQGDVLLSEMGKLIRDNCRATDVPFRYGGDELCILLADTTAEEARVVAERIRTSAREVQLVQPSDDPVIGAQAIVTMSIGVASFPADGYKPHQLFERADSAMFRAKETGKDRVCVFDPAVDNIKRNFRQRIERPEDYKDDRLTLPISLQNELNIESLFSQTSDSKEPLPLSITQKIRISSASGLEVAGMEEVEEEEIENLEIAETPTSSRGFSLNSVEVQGKKLSHD